MSKPKNGAARNTMSEFERQCYDWGWEDAERNAVEVVSEVINHLWRKLSAGPEHAINNIVAKLYPELSSEQRHKLVRTLMKEDSND